MTSNKIRRCVWLAAYGCLHGLCLTGWLVAISGCASTEYNIATQKEDILFVSTEREVAMGKSISREVEEKFKPTEDATLQDRIDAIGQKIAAVCDRRDIFYHFKVINDDEVNAFALPGGYVYLNKGLTDKASSDDEIAAVIAHEVGHVVAKHSVKRLQGVLSYEALAVLATIAAEDKSQAYNANIAFGTLVLAYSREDELLADKMGVRYMKKAGYKPDAMISFLNKLEKEKPKKGSPTANKYLRSHPYISDRIRVVREESEGKTVFLDFINRSDY